MTRGPAAVPLRQNPEDTVELRHEGGVEFVSCNARQLYRVGGFHEGPVLADQLARQATPEIEVHQEIFPAYSYERKLPGLVGASEAFRAELLQYYRTINREYPTGASCMLAQLSNATLSRNVLYVLHDGKRQVVYETYRPHDRPYTSLLDADVAAEEIPVSADTLHFLLSSVGSFNYGHWLLDDVARLQAVRTLRSAYPGCEIVIWIPTYRARIEPAFSTKWDDLRSQTIDKLLHKVPGCRVALYDYDKAYSFKQLFYPTPISYHPYLKSPEALNLLTEWFAAPWWRIRLRRATSRLLVMRSPMRGRQVENMDCIRSLLERRGFRSVDPETLTTAEQAAAFAQADVVVGVMGASMSNTVFCMPGTRVIHLAPEGWLEAFYWDLAAIRGHTYAACYGEAPSNDAIYMGTFRIPEQSLLGILGALDS
jgi:hypothetical protein